MSASLLTERRNRRKAEEARTERVAMRLGGDELALLMLGAERRSLPLRTYIRIVALEDAAGISKSPSKGVEGAALPIAVQGAPSSAAIQGARRELQVVIRELQSIGISLNQISVAFDAATRRGQNLSQVEIIRTRNSRSEIVNALASLGAFLSGPCTRGPEEMENEA